MSYSKKLPLKMAAIAMACGTGLVEGLTEVGKKACGSGRGCRNVIGPIEAGVGEFLWKNRIVEVGGRL